MKYIFSILFILMSPICRGQSIFDIDGNAYNTVTIGTQRWTTENLKTTRYSDGSVIQYVAIDSLWGGLTMPAFCTYDNNTIYRAEYGNLYNFYAVMDTRNICPSGWHVPSYYEWSISVNYLGGMSMAGGKMKEIGFAHWDQPNIGATNSSGLTVLPAGYRYGFHSGGFNALNGNGAIWTTTSSSTLKSVMTYFYPGDSSMDMFDQYKSYGLSVRCVSNISTDIFNNEISEDVNMFPNPSGDILTIEIDGQKNILITNLQGQIIKTIKTKLKTISLAGLANGNYFVSVFNYDNKLIARKQIVYLK